MGSFGNEPQWFGIKFMQGLFVRTALATVGKIFTIFYVNKID